MTPAFQKNTRRNIAISSPAPRPVSRNFASTRVVRSRAANGRCSEMAPRLGGVFVRAPEPDAPGWAPKPGLDKLDFQPPVEPALTGGSSHFLAYAPVQT